MPDTRIRPLSPEVIGQIAAGEVVERPSAAIKELVENSMDAGATAITVDLRDGGLTSFRVVDNGAGIAPTDLKMAFERHATSKIKTVSDLYGVQTMGFRGEALASIAAVSRVTCLTRTRGAEFGMSLVNEGGMIRDIREAACPEGTSFTVKDIFFNAPVRRKFMKKPSSETSYVSELMLRFILSHPNVSFRYVADGKTVYFSAGDGKLESAVMSVYGLDVLGKLRPVSGCASGLALEGFIGVGEASRGNRAHESFMLNGRLIKSALLTAAVEDACRQRVMIGRFPLCVLHLTMPFEAADVNVHPNKWEVRFQNESAVRDAVTSLVHDALKDASPVDAAVPLFPGVSAAPAAQIETRSSVPVSDEEKHSVVVNHKAVVNDVRAKVDNSRTNVYYERTNVPIEEGKSPLFSTSTHPLTGVMTAKSSPFPAPGLAQREQPAPGTVDYTAIKKPSAPALKRSHEPESDANEANANKASANKTSANEANANEAGANGAPHVDTENTPLNNDIRRSETQHVLPTDNDLHNVPNENAPSPAAVASVTDPVVPESYEQTASAQVENAFSTQQIKLLGVVFDTYIVLECADRMLLCDQHAVHERILFDRMMRALDGDTAAQMLLVPELTRLTHREYAAFIDNRDALLRAGFDADDYGELSVQLRAVPMVLGTASGSECLRDALDELSDGGQISQQKRVERIIQMACKHAVKGGEKLPMDALYELVRNMLRDNVTPTCPHGRPLIVSVTHRDLDKRFRRIQG